MMRSWWVVMMLCFWVVSAKAAPTLTLNVEEADLTDVLSLVAKAIPLAITVSPRVHGSVSVHWNRVDPRASFDLLLAMNGLMRQPYGNLWYVAAPDEFIDSANRTLKWQSATEAVLPLETRLYRIRYGVATTLAQVLSNSKEALLSRRAEWHVDERTNVLAVTDTAARLAKLDGVIHGLDVPVQQILIEARLANVDQTAESALGLDFSVTGNEGALAKSGYYSVAVAHLADGSSLDVRLAALQAAGKAELISSPTLFTVNQRPASIESGEEVPYQEVSESGGTAIAFKKAVLGLQVVPQILPGGEVMLALKINQDRPDALLVQGMPVITTRQITTQVVVKQGQTVVLGGIYEMNRETTVERVPYLSALPFIGRWFEVKTQNKTKRELLIFVTPKLIAQPS